jgi:Tol biopolymer transport system component
MKLGWNVLAISVAATAVGGWTYALKPGLSSAIAVSQAKVKCPYCGTMNTAKAKACTSCKGNLDFASYPAVTRLTKSDGADIQPAWGPNGKVAYSSSQQGNFIFVMNADGSGPTKLPSSETLGDFQPSFGPGGKIAFVGKMVSNDIFVMDADGQNRKRLEDFSADDVSPSWSMQGKIVFSSDRGTSNKYNLYVIDPSGGEATAITKDAGNNFNPCWSPDGKKIVFNSDREGNHEIYVMDADGTNVKRITNNAAEDYDPSWGPDGRIAFVSDRGQSPDIFMMNSDGTGQKMLTNNKWQDLRPAFGPGGKILFQSRRDAGTGLQEDIFVMTALK